MAFSALSCSISISISLVRSSISLVRRSISRTGRQLRVDKNCRHGGSDEKGSPLLLERDACAGEGDVVIGGEQSDQAEQQTTDGLEPAEPIEAGPGSLGGPRFWRTRRWLAGRALGSGHGLDGWGRDGGASGGGVADPPPSSATNAAWRPIGNAGLHLPRVLRNALRLSGDPIDPPQGVASLSRHGQHGGHPALSRQETADAAGRP